MPVRNARETVEAAIASVQAETIADWELVIVDDGSKDGTLELLRKIAASDPRIVLIEQEPKGIAEALNRGLASCRGEFVARMDADDVMSEQRLELQSAFLAANRDFGLVSCRVRFGGSEAGYAAHVDWINSLTSPDEMSLRRFVEAPVAHQSVMFRGELIETHGGYRDGPFPEDYELWLRWMEAGARGGARSDADTPSNVRAPAAPRGLRSPDVAADPRLEHTAEQLRAHGFHVCVHEDRLRCAREVVDFEVEGMGKLDLLQDAIFVSASDGGLDVLELRGQRWSLGVFASAEEVVGTILQARPAIGRAGER